LSNPNTNIRSGSVGTITSVNSNPRTIQLALKLYF